VDVWELNPEGVVIVLADSLCDLSGGESFWLRASMIGEDRLYPLLNYTLEFTLQLRKTSDRVVRKYSLR
jgi:hypothetical protein